MRREEFTREHVLAAMGEHGIGNLQGVQMAVLEVEGAISIGSKEATMQKTRCHFRGLRIQ